MFIYLISDSKSDLLYIWPTTLSSTREVYSSNKRTKIINHNILLLNELAGFKLWLWETYLFVVQTRLQMPPLRGQLQLQQKSLSWCYQCTSLPLMCTGHLHWPRLKAQAEQSQTKGTSKRKVLLPQDVILTYYKEHPRCVTKEESFLHDPLSISHVNTDQGDHYAGQVHLNVSHPQGCLWALQHFLKVHTLK